RVAVPLRSEALRVPRRGPAEVRSDLDWGAAAGRRRGRGPRRPRPGPRLPPRPRRDLDRATVVPVGWFAAAGADRRALPDGAGRGRGTALKAGGEEPRRPAVEPDGGVMKGKPLGGSQPLGPPRPPGKVPRRQNNSKLTHLVK